MKKLLSLILITFMLAAACMSASAQGTSSTDTNDASPVEYYGVQSTGINEGYYSLRFLAVLKDDYKNYKNLGFKVTADNDNYSTSCSKVYNSILEGNRVTSADDLGGKYIFALTVRNIPVNEGDLVFRVVPYYTKEGSSTVSYGKECTVVYNKGKYFAALPTARAASLNLKNNTDATGTVGWESRRENIVSFISSSLPDSIGVQECESKMYEYLNEQLAGIPYKSANKEHYALLVKYAFKNFIFYNENTTTLVKSGEIWLKNGGTSPTLSGDYYISAGWAILESKATGEQYVHINTHINSGEESYKNNEIEQLLTFIRENTDFVGKRIILTGDFNSHDDTTVYKSIKDEGFTDFRDTAKFTTDTNTYNQFTSSISNLDYCFCKGDNMTALKFNVTEKWGTTPSWLSDHNALVVDFAFTSSVSNLGEIGSNDEDSMTWGSPNN